jgi:transcriptional regulator with XRE-family HTH domain
MEEDTSDSRPIRVRFASDSRPIDEARPIHASDSSIGSCAESDALERLSERLALCIGDATVSSFARSCGLPEATIRSYLDGRKPVFDKLVKIANAAGVTLDWLATGKGSMRPQTRMERSFSPQRHALRWEKIIALVEGIEDEEQRAKALDELFSRAQSAAELAELRQAVRQLQKASPKAA